MKKGKVNYLSNMSPFSLFLVVTVKEGEHANLLSFPYSCLRGSTGLVVAALTVLRAIVIKAVN